MVAKAGLTIPQKGGRLDRDWCWDTFLIVQTHSINDLRIETHGKGSIMARSVNGRYEMHVALHGTHHENTNLVGTKR